MRYLNRRDFCAAAAIAGLYAAGFTLTGCSDDSDSSSSSSDGRSIDVEQASEHLRDADALYADDNPTSIVCMFLTVRKGNSAESTDHTWTEVNTYSKYWYAERDLTPYGVEAILQVGDEKGPLPGELGYSTVVPNAIVRVRGQSSSRYTQKNYKVEIKDDCGYWREQQTINLNKHEQDGMRFRNKLAYDMLKTIPQTISARTQFVHLYVKDETEGSKDAFTDYGLYTQVEQMNKTYLKAHGFDNNGQLYKVVFFEYYRYEDIIKLKTDTTYDESVFENYLEIKGNDDHTKLISMLDDVNNYSLDIGDVFEKWFDSENVLYWMAFQILFGNFDTSNRNYMLYSPLNVDKFYLISWDMDSCLQRTELALRGVTDGAQWERGLSLYWGNVLYARLFKEQKYVDALSAAVEDLYAHYVTEATVTDLAQAYAGVTKPYAFATPDLTNEPLTQAQFNEILAALPSEVGANRDSYYESLKKPMPFNLDVPTKLGNKLQCTWAGAYDLQGQQVTYHAILAKDYLCNEIIAEEDNLSVPLLEADMPGEGQYFLQVTATNEAGYTQTAFDYYVIDSSKVYGTLCFYVLADGSLISGENAEEV